MKSGGVNNSAGRTRKAITEGKAGSAKRHPCHGGVLPLKACLVECEIFCKRAGRGRRQENSDRPSCSARRRPAPPAHEPACAPAPHPSGLRSRPVRRRASKLLLRRVCFRHFAMSSLSRRSFLQQLAVGAVAAPFVTRGLVAQPPSARINHATFGASGMAWSDVTSDRPPSLRCRWWRRAMWT